MKTNEQRIKELKERIEELEFQEKRIEEIRNIKINIIDVEKFKELSNELSWREAEFNEETLREFRKELQAREECQKEIETLKKEIAELKVKQIFGEQQ